MAMAKKRADKELQKAILAEHDSAPELKRTLRSKFRTKDRKGDELVSAKSFEEVLAPYALSERTLRNLKRRYELDGKVDYATFLDDAVALYVAVSGGGANSDGDSDAGRAKLLSDSDGGGASSDSSMSSANATKRKLEPTVEETLQGELEKRFSDKAPCERKLKRAWDQVTGGKEPMIGKTALSKILKSAGIKLNSDHLRSIHKAFCPKVGGSKRMDWHEFVSYCGVLHRGKRNTRGRRASARGSEIDLIAADLRAKIMDEDPDEIFDGFAFEGSEFISPGDFEDAILNIWPKMLRSEIDRLMSRFDKDDDNMISRDEFHAFLNIDKVLEERKSNKNKNKSRGSNSSEDEEDEPNPGAALDRALRRKLAEAYKDDSRGQMKKAFRPFDKRGVGVISTKQFKTALEQLSEDMRGLRLSKSDISAIAKAYARSRGYGKSEVKYNLFVKLCAGKYKKVSTKKRAVGDRVSAKCTGWTRYFEGEITKVNRDGTYAIKFDDGERQKGVTEDQIKGDLVDSDDSDGDERGRRSQGKKRSSSRSRKRRVGDRVEAKVSGWTKYFSGEITKVNSDGTYAIVFDDGEKQKYVSEEEIKGSPVGSDSDDDVYDRRRDDKASSRDRDRDRKHRVGDTVSTKCSGWTKYFSGEITKVNTDGTYAILFEDGERKKYVTEAEIQGGSSRGGGSISPQLQDTIDQMKRIYSRAVRKGRAESFREIFEEIDSNRSGKISASEFYRALRDMDMDVDRQDAKDVVGHFDLDRDGKIDYDEFLIICGAAHGDRDRNVRGSRDRDVRGSRDRDVRGSRDRDLRGNRNTRGSSRATEEFADDLARIFKDAVRTGEAHNLEEIFDALDTRKLGSISSRAFEGVILDELQVRPPSDRALREIMQEFDVDGDGRISIREFIDFCTKRGGYEGPIGRSGGYSRDKENVRGSSSRSSSLRGDLAVVAERLADALADQVSRRGARSLRDVFEDLDRSDRGFIELRDFERALENDLRLRIDRKDLNSLVRRFDTNRDGKIEYREFERFCEDHCGYRERAVRRSSRDDRRALDADRRPLRASRDRYDDDRAGYRGSRDRMSSSCEHRDRDRGPDSDQVRSDEVQDIAERLAKRFKMMARGSSRSLNLEDVFDRFDVERVGSISVIEFERLLEDEVEFVLSRREMRALTGKFDRNKDGRVDRREFMDFCFSNGYSAPPKLTQRELDLKFQEARKRVQRGFDESRSVGRIREHIRMFKDRDIDRTGILPVRSISSNLPFLCQRARG